MESIDLHIHTVYSDGTFKPKEIVTCAKAKGLSAISITDHDTINGLEEGKKYAQSLGIEFINGVEINSCCTLNNRVIRIHILGYMFDAAALKGYMEGLKEAREEHNNEIFKALHRIGIDLDYMDLEMQFDESMPTRLNFAKALVKKGYARTVDHALKEFLHKEGKAYVEFHDQPFSVVVQQIHAAGGIVSFAHPAQCGLCDEELEILVGYLVGEGLDAIECIHPSHDILYAHKMMNLASEYHLMRTGGSDFHGKSATGIDLGMGGDQMAIPQEFFNILRKKRCI